MTTRDGIKAGTSGGTSTYAIPVPLVERDDLLASLDGLLDAIDGGDGRVVLIPGEAGVGKTTFVDAWLRRHADRVRLRRGTCDGSATPAPLAPVGCQDGRLRADRWPADRGAHRGRALGGRGHDRHVAGVRGA